MKDTSSEKYWFDIVPPEPPNEGILFVDHSQQGRSGHLGHALVEYEHGKILAFYPNCSDKNNGHTGDGWMEYKRSENGGKTWSGAKVLPYSKDVYDSRKNRSVMCEKAVQVQGGDIILFNYECGNVVEKDWAWKPIYVPTCLRSTDSGNTWESPQPVGDERGRIYDAIYQDGTIYVLEHCNDSENTWWGNLPQHHYSLYVSTDGGGTFTRRSLLPFDFYGRGYGTMSFLKDGSLIAYVYNIKDEKNLEYVTSSDCGHTWSKVKKAHFTKQIRNPQMAAFKRGYVLHGRSGSEGRPEVKGHFVLYSSQDGINWDEGRYLKMRQAGEGAYSNNLMVHDSESGNAEGLLIQASHAYDRKKTNIYHWLLH